MQNQENKYPNERELPDDYPIYGMYYYVADNEVILSDWHDITAREFKIRENIKSLKNCDLAARDLL